MRLPAIHELNDFNRLAIAINVLSVDKSGCTYKAVVYLCTSMTFGGRSFNHRAIFRLAEYAGMVRKEGRNLRLTNTGIKFLELNPTRTYELTLDQKSFLATTTLINGPWSSSLRDLFLAFSPNYEDLTFIYNIKILGVQKRHSSTIHLLKNLGILDETNGLLSVSPFFVSQIVELRGEPNGVTEPELDAALNRRRKLSAIAEDAVVEFERKRLISLGRAAEAALVRRISQLDVSAGYDIESFNGDGKVFEYDRFIEVKSSQQSDIRFFWTANEVEVANQLKQKYWIYFVPNTEPKKPSKISPVIINDPVNVLMGSTDFNITTAKYFIHQSSGLEVEHKSFNGLEWFAF